MENPCFEMVKNSLYFCPAIKMERTKEIEIMSPVGSHESLMAAIQGGADSVYFGAGHLNMRSRSSANFSLEDLKSISKICQEHGIRSYLTLNTVIYDDELELMRQIIDVARDNGINAIIASDQAVINYARKKKMEIHISTQANISNIEAVKFHARYADVIVTARELNLEQVKAITKAIQKDDVKGPSGGLVRIEVFAHGALCMAISGKCYLSLDIFNSAANRGACMQPCRRPYKVFDRDGEVELEVDNQYIMSPKDLKTIDFLDKIMDAGVKVLKIEGRGRSPEYVKVVTRCYRDAVNAILEGNFTKDKLETWNSKLETVYNRGFWDGYYLGRRLGEWSGKYGSQATRKKIYVGKIMNHYPRINVAEVKLEAQSLSVGDRILILGPTTGVLEDEVSEIRIDDNRVKRTVRGELCTIPVKDVVRVSDKLYKWVDSTEVPAQND
jgi:putative protease